MVEEWRAQLKATGAMFESDLDELESHLLDRMDALVEEGHSRASAFHIASEELGDSSALADEFAKVNPLLAWRAALFWLSSGVLLVLGLRPLQLLALHGAIVACLALRVSDVVMTAAVGVVGFASPLAFFALAFFVARRRLEARAPSRLTSTAAFRGLAIVGAAVMMLAAHLGVDWGMLSSPESVLIEKYGWSRSSYWQAFEAFDLASYALAVVAPVVLGTVAYRFRARAMRDRARATAAPLFWLAIGFFVGAIRSGMSMFVRLAAFASGAVARFDAGQMRAVMWIVTLGSPCLLAAATYTFLRHRAPPPQAFLRARGVLVALAFSAAAGIAAVFATAPIAVARRQLPPDVLDAGATAWVFAGIVTSCVLPIVVGAIVFRSGHCAHFSDQRPSHTPRPSSFS